MDWKNIDNYFNHIPTTFLKELFENSEFPWSPLARLTERIEGFFVDIQDNGSLAANRKVVANRQGVFQEGSYHVLQTEILQEDFVDKELNIFIGSGTFIEAGATVKNHTIVEKNCEIRQGAYLRGYAYIGEKSVVGHTTEIKNSVFIRHVEAGHFAYIGDSIVGSFVNLGAGTKISNLEFRSLEAKQQERFPEIDFRVGKQKIKTGLSKFGAIVGDGCETGCNSVLCPFVLLEPKCWILPNLCVSKGIYSKGSILRNRKKSAAATDRSDTGKLLA
ncbi:MAG: glucose-1-phosphate thymidylyltransferase [Proteobacteria bacterium]|nr:glucose-1-phosphate thymidylyltransferase [Pseudomonadota bacterium]